MFRDYGEPGPSSGAGGAYGGPTQPPATGQQVRGTRHLESTGGQRRGERGPLRHTRGLGPGTGGGTRYRSGGSGSCLLSAVQRHFLPHSLAEHARREEHISASIGPSARPPSPLSVVSLSLRLCYLLSFLLFTVNFFVPSASEGDPLGPGLVPAPTGSERVPIHLGRHFRGPESKPRPRGPHALAPPAGLPGQTGNLGQSVCGRPCACLFVCPSPPHRQVLIPVQPQWSWWGPGDWLLTPLRVGARGDREMPGRARGLATGNSRAPDSRHRTAPAAGWGDLGGCRCPFPVEGR